jgi:hypothetical protein
MALATWGAAKREADAATPDTNFNSFRTQRAGGRKLIWPGHKLNCQVTKFENYASHAHYSLMMLLDKI